MSMTYYFISDLHIGGDEALGVCDYEVELIEFLEKLAAQQEEAELLIIGDIFGLWEFTDIEGPEKLKAVMDQFPNIFKALQKTGETVKITMLPGNHDYEIACYPEFVEMLKPYNIHLEQTPAITREIGGKRIWIEHGNQYDAFNHMPDFGNPYAQPIGYFIASSVVSTAGKHSKFGKYNWLKDIQSVYPSEQIPYWVLSNYFYHEMSPLLRWLILPFVLLSGFEIFILGGAALEWFGKTDTNIFLNNRLFSALGIVGNLVQLILMVNTVLFVMLYRLGGAALPDLAGLQGNLATVSDRVRSIRTEQRERTAILRGSPKSLRSGSGYHNLRLWPHPFSLAATIRQAGGDQYRHLAEKTRYRFEPLPLLAQHLCSFLLSQLFQNQRN